MEVEHNDHENVNDASESLIQPDAKSPKKSSSVVAQNASLNELENGILIFSFIYLISDDLKFIFF